MKKQKQSLTETQLLRQKAEELHKRKISSNPIISGDSDILKLNHELSVHQLELEMQNSELLKAKEDLEGAVEKYTDLYDFAPTGYVTLSMEGRIIGLNFNASNMLGKERSLLIKNVFSFFVADDTKQIFNSFLKEISNTKIEQSCEVTILNKDNLQKYVYLIGTLSKDGLCCEISMIDITDRKLAEGKIIVTNNKLEQSLRLNEDKDLFISVLAHDLRNPFGVLLGYADLLIKNGKELSEKEFNNFLVEINRTALNTYNLLEDLLKWSRLRMGKIPFDPQRVNFTDICIDILSSLTPIAESKKIVVKCSTTEEINVIGDIDMLKAIFRNLVSNSIKFTNSNGIIKISAEHENSNITFSVSDNGIGIEPERLTKLFDMSQIHTSTGTANEKGTGLGLLLCKDFVEKHGGKIWAESEYGKGSTFYFSIPFKSEFEGEKLIMHQVKDDHGFGLKVLIVDDNAGLRMILGSMLKSYCREILYAETGIEAVITSENNPDIDLIFMDIYMPKMDGSEAIKLIRRINKKVIIIVETGKTLSEITEKSSGDEINDYFFKPYSRTFLNELIHKYFNNKNNNTSIA